MPILCAENAERDELVNSNQIHFASRASQITRRRSTLRTPCDTLLGGSDRKSVATAMYTYRCEQAIVSSCTMDGPAC